MLLILVLLSQAPAPCGSKSHPCYVQGNDVLGVSISGNSVVDGTITVTQQRAEARDAGFVFYPYETKYPITYPWVTDENVCQLRLDTAERQHGVVAVTVAILTFLAGFVLALWVTRQSLLDAWVRSEKKLPSLPRHMRGLLYAFVTPALTTLLAAGVVRATGHMLNVVVPDAMGGFFTVVAGLAGVVLGLASALDER